MKDLTKIYIDLSKCTEEQVRTLNQITDGYIDQVSEFPLLFWDEEQWNQSQSRHDVDIIKKTELTYPEFIKLFEGGDDNNGWIKIESELPPPNVLVWVKRVPNKVERVPLYIAMRNGQALSKNSDASTNCHWSGMHQNALKINQKTHQSLRFDSSFSDVTVMEWRFVEPPKF